MSNSEQMAHIGCDRQDVEIASLKRTITQLQDFALWMTGCGYNFTQHDYFNRQRDKLLLSRDDELGVEGDRGLSEAE